MAVHKIPLGPGTFTLGTTPGTDYSCQVQSAGLNVDKDEGDTITVLCGDQIPGSLTYTYTLAGTVLQDYDAADGIVQYSWEHKGETVDFTFVPNTAAATSAAGQVVVDPLSFGLSDGEFGDPMTSDFEFSVVGEPDITWPTAAAATSSTQQPEPEPVGA